MFKKTTLANKLRVILTPKADSQSVAMSFFVRAGSRFETAAQNGIAHFLEHLAFQGTQDFPSQLELSKFVEGFGGDINAYTGNETITYYVRAESSNFPKLAYVLDQMLYHSLYRDEDIDRERGVIVEELNRAYDVAADWVQIMVDGVMWPNHPLGRNILGNKETLASFKHQDFIDFKTGLFEPENMVLGVSGRFDEEEVLNEIKSRFEKVKGLPVRDFERVGETSKGPKVQVETRPIEQSNVCVNFTGVKLSDPRRQHLRLLAMILGGGLSSRLFQKIRTEMGLAYDIHAASSEFIDTGSLQIFAGLNGGKCYDGISEILKIAREVAKMGVTSEELYRQKEHLKGLLAIRFEDHQVANALTSNHELLEGRSLTYDDVVKEIDATSLDDVKAISQEVLSDSNLSIAVVGNATQKGVESAV